MDLRTGSERADPERVGDPADEWVIAEYSRRRRRQFAVTAVVVAPVLCLFLFGRDSPRIQEFLHDQKVFGGSFLAVVVGLLLFSLWNWRCPKCRSYLGKAMRQRFCRSCGVQLAK